MLIYRKLCNSGGITKNVNKNKPIGWEDFNKKIKTVVLQELRSLKQTIHAD